MSFSQEKKEVYLDQTITDQKILSGQINNKYDITVYLKHYAPSPEHENIYSVQGWYYYNSVKKKISLVGIYQQGSLTLYHFDSKPKADSVLNWLSKKELFWEIVDDLQSFEGYQEKFIYSNNGEPNVWKDQKKSLSLNFYDFDNQIRSESHFLKIKTNVEDEVYAIKLEDLGIYESSFDLVASSNNSNGFKVILEFSTMSNPFANGRCGAGSEEGFYKLSFDSNYSLIDIQRVLIESCNEFIYNEERLIKNTDNYIFDVTENDSIFKVVTIDREKLEILVETTTKK